MSNNTYRTIIHNLADKISSDKSLIRLYRLAEYLYIKEDEKTELKSGGMDYKRLIIEMVETIENIWILDQILQFIQNMTKDKNA